MLDTSFERVPAEAEGKVPTGYGFWVNSWPANPGWKFVAVGIGWLCQLNLRLAGIGGDPQ